MAIAGQKALKPKHVRMIRTPNDYWSTSANLEQADPPQNQGAHDPFTQFRLGDEQSPQALGRNHERFNRCLRYCINECRAAGNLSKFAKECTGFITDDMCRRPRARALSDLDVPRQNDGETLTHFADVGQRRPGREAANFPETR